MMITPNTKLNMVIGHPLQHTQSPLLHNTLYQALNLDAVLVAVPHTDVHALIQVIKTLNVGLTAVTMPFKADVVPYLDEASEEVTCLGVANTIIQRQQRLLGYNTDVDGVRYALKHLSLSQKNVLVIGAGGAARALAYYLHQQQANLYWLNRTPEKLEALISLFGGKVADQESIRKLPFDLIVNTTPVGMHAHTADQSPLMNYPFQAKQVVFDLVYHPMLPPFSETSSSGWCDRYFWLGHVYRTRIATS